MLGRPDMDAALTDDDDDQLQHSHRPPTNAEVGDDLLGRACRGGEMGWSGMGGAAHGKDSSSSDDDLAHCVRAPPAAATHAKRSTSSSSSSSSSSSDDDWGVVRTCHIDVHRLDASTTSSSSSDDDGLLFMPEPVFKLNSLHKKPDLPYHTKEDLRNGSSVWIVDEEDVETHLRSHWSLSYKRVCNGRLRGTVVRHLGDMTVVQFQADQGFIFSLTMPRPCLSLKRIDAYDSPSGNFNQLVSSCYLNLGPRATRGRSEGNRQPRSICQQYYELLPVLDVPSASVAFLGDAQTKFQQGLLSQALKLVDEALEIVKNGSTIVDALVLRSRIYVFMEQYGMALDAAKECIRRDPQCARGFLCAARAHSGLGNFSSAGEALATAISLDPQGDAFRPLVALNQYMMGLQLELEKRTDALRLTLDFMYCKRLQACRAIPMGTLVMTEDMPIMATHSLFSLRPPTMCSVCLREGAKEMEVNINGITAVSPINMSSPSSNTSSGTEKSWLRLRPSFCCPECHARSMLYIPMEQQHKESVANAKELIIGKASVTLDTYPLEMGYMTIRLFFVLVTIHCRLASLKKTGTTEAGATPHVVPIEAALRELGIFPLASDGLTVRTREEALIVYRVLTNKFRPEDKEIYSSDLFVSLYNYVRSYFTPVKISDHNTTTSRATRSFYLPYLIGCADRDKTLCCFSSGGKSFFPSTELSCAKTTVPNCKVQLLLDSDMAALRQKDRHGDPSPASQPPRATEEETRSGPTSDTEGDFPKRRPLLKLIAWTDIKDGEWLMLPPFVIDTIEH